MRRAAVDVGSNSVLLTVEEASPDGWRPVLETSEVTALGEDAKRTGLLKPEAIARTLAAVRRAFGRARDLDASEVRAAATMAARIAENRSELLAAAAGQRTPITVLSGEAEAALSLLSVVLDARFAESGRVSVIDIGGHSTEVSRAERSPGTRFGWSIAQSVSLPIGTLALIAESLVAECPDSGALLRASAEVDGALRSIASEEPAGEAVTVGATGTNLVTVRDALAEWDASRVHGAMLTFEEVARAVGELSRLTLAERGRLVGMEPGREKTLHAGALILERAMHALRVERVAVSVRGWRHAWLELGYPAEVEW